MCPETPKTHLNFVGNAHASGGPDMTVNLAQISGRENDLPGNAGQRLGDPGGGTADLLQDFRYVSGILRAEIRFALAMQSAIVVGDGCDADPGFATSAARAVELVWTDIDERSGVARTRISRQHHYAHRTCMD